MIHSRRQSPKSSFPEYLIGKSGNFKSSGGKTLQFKNPRNVMSSGTVIGVFKELRGTFSGDPMGNASCFITVG